LQSVATVTLSLERFYFITGKILKVFDKVSEKFDLVWNWAVVLVGELMSFPVDIISNL